MPTRLDEFVIILRELHVIIYLLMLVDCPISTLLCFILFCCDSGMLESMSATNWSNGRQTHDQYRRSSVITSNMFGSIDWVHRVYFILY